MDQGRLEMIKWGKSDEKEKRFKALEDTCAALTKKVDFITSEHVELLKKHGAVLERVTSLEANRVALADQVRIVEQELRDTTHFYNDMLIDRWPVVRPKWVKDKNDMMDLINRQFRSIMDMQIEINILEEKTGHVHPSKIRDIPVNNDSSDSEVEMHDPMKKQGDESYSEYRQRLARMRKKVEEKKKAEEDESRVRNRREQREGKKNQQANTKGGSSSDSDD